MEILKKIKSVKLCLMAHPDNEIDSEFADRISDLEEIENELSKDKWIKIKNEDDLPKDGKIFWVMKIGYSYPIVETLYNDDANYWLTQFTHYQPIIKPNLPLT